MNINHILEKDISTLSMEEYKEINSYLLNRMTIELEKKDRSGIYGVTQREFAYNSNRIEGSQLSKEQTASLFDTGTLMSDGEIYRSKDIEETTGHFLMFHQVIQTMAEPLAQELIKSFHKALKQGVFEDRANGYPIGEYKNRVNIVWDIETVAPDQVPQKMQELLEQYESSDRQLEDITRLHVNYEKIHPFQDGNGRTGRMVLFRECLKNKTMPLIIEDNNKEQYTHLLNKAQKTDEMGELLLYFKREQVSYYKLLQKFLKEY